MRQIRRPGLYALDPRSHAPGAREGRAEVLLLVLPFARVEVRARPDRAVPEAAEDAVAEEDFGGGHGGPEDFAGGGVDFGGVRGGALWGG